MKKLLCTCYVLFLGILLLGCGKEDDVTQPTTEEKTAKKIVTTTTEVSTTEAVTEASTEEVNKKGEYLIALDPGHQSPAVDMSATEPNAPGSSEMKTKATGGTTGQYTGVPEYQLNLDIALMVRDALQAEGYNVIMTREDNDTAISNKERACLANDAGADISVRIHANGSEDSSTNGALVLVGSAQNPYVGSLYEESKRLGNNVLDAYCESTGMKNLGIQDNDTMTGINWSQIPVIILEMGFMSNEQDDRNMQDASYQKNMVEGIVRGINDYFDLEEDLPEETGTASKLSRVEECLKDAIDAQTQLGSSVSAYVKDIDSDSSAGVNDTISMQAASLIKLYIAGAVYEEMSKSEDWNVDSTDALVEIMLSVSDNDAANTLVEKLGKGDTQLGMQKVNDFCAAHNLTDTHMGRLLLAPADTDDNYTSAVDTAAFLASVYKGNLEGSDKILAYLKKQARTGKLPQGIPEGIQTANKTGELSDVENDAAIVFLEDKPYVICVMTQNLSDTAQARVWMSDLSGKVFQEMAE